MTGDGLSEVLRVLDNENHLLERADQKAISLLSVLGVFMVFFIVYYRLMPVNVITVVLVSVYFIFALMAIVSLIMTVRPRIWQSGRAEAVDDDNPPPGEPAFFAGICKFPTLSAYKQSLEGMIKDEASAIDIYARQIFSLARINAVKYKYIQRAVMLTIITLTTELAIIAYLFAYHLGQGSFPPLVG